MRGIRAVFIIFMGVCMGGAAFAEMVDIGSTIPPYTLKDQHEQEHSLADETQTLIVSAEMKLSKEFHAWLSERDAQYLPEHNTEYISDITGMPGIITFLFAMPKMKKYPFRILFSDDGSLESVYPREEKKITVLELGKDHVVEAIHYVDTTADLQSIIERENP